jgi:YD repeat-containing protein
MSYQYNDLGRKVKETNGLNQNTLYSYDRWGNLTLQTLPNGDSVAYLYSADGRELATRNERRAGSTSIVRSTGYQYHPSGLISQVSHPELTQSNSYDTSGAASLRLLSKSDNRGSSTKTTSYTYSPGGRLQTLQDPEGRQLSYSYDATGRLRSIQLPGSHSIQMTYDKVGRLVERLVIQTNGERLRSRYSYNPDNTLLSLTSEASPDGVSRSQVSSHTDHLTQKPQFAVVFFVQDSAPGQRTLTPWPSTSAHEPRHQRQRRTLGMHAPARSHTVQQARQSPTVLYLNWVTC